MRSLAQQVILAQDGAIGAALPPLQAVQTQAQENIVKRPQTLLIEKPYSGGKEGRGKNKRHLRTRGAKREGSVELGSFLFFLRFSLSFLLYFFLFLCFRFTCIFFSLFLLIYSSLFLYLFLSLFLFLYFPFSLYIFCLLPHF
uniref:Uncharacterized protein n=1 Tax=Rhipicephalus pulchellus TaxID=72859 RepID=L7M1K3_RHIPC